MKGNKIAITTILLFFFFIFPLPRCKMAEDKLPLDENPPIIIIVSPSPGLVSSSSQISCQGTIKDEESGIKEIFVNAVPIYVESDNAPKIYTINFNVMVSLQVGKNSISVEAQDQAGNRSIEFVDVTYEDQSKPPIVLEIWIGKLYAFVDKEYKKLEVAPIITNGRTIVPLRFIAEGFNAQIAYDSKTQIIKISTENIYILLQINHKKAVVERKVNDQIESQELVLDAPPTLQKGRTIIPLRFIAEAFLAITEWNPHEEKITISLIR